LTAFDDLDEGTLGTRPTMSHVTARQEVEHLLSAIGLAAVDAGAVDSDAADPGIIDPDATGQGAIDPGATGLDQSTEAGQAVEQKRDAA
jgi:hypothetical protein